MYERQPDDLDQALPPVGEGTAIAKGNGDEAGWTKVPDTLNIWQPKEVGEQCIWTVLTRNYEGKFGLQVQVIQPDGSVVMLPSHKYLQSRLLSVKGGLQPHKTKLRVTFTGKKESEEEGRSGAELYDVEYKQLK